MVITNKFGLPEPIANFARADKYTKGASDISVTTLIDSPRINILRSHHSDEIDVDVSDMVWALFGTAVHRVLETTKENDNVIVEERLYADIGGWTLSGQLDHQELLPDGTLQITDYKVTSVWSVILGKKEWERQQNVYAWLVENSKDGKFNGTEVSSIRICAILRDWQRKKAEFDADYPQSPITMVELPLWEHRDEYVADRLLIHQEAQINFDMYDRLPLCSSEEQWAKPDTWAVKKKGQKRAIRVHHSEEEAVKHVNSNSALREMGQARHKGSCEIEHRKGELTRCASYCAVSEYCEQYKGWKKNEHK